MPGSFFDKRRIAAMLNRRNWGLFSKIFAVLVGVSIVPVIACSLFFYFISRQNVEAEVSLSNLDTLKQTQMAVDNILEATERISQQIVRNKEVANFMTNPIDKSRQGNPAVTNAINVADSFSEGVQYIESISIYSFLNNMLVSSGTQRYAEMDDSFMDNYGNSIRTKGFTMWIEPDDSELFGEKSRSLQFVEFIFETFNKPEGIVLIKLRNDEFAKLINAMYIRKSGHIFVVNDKGKVILGRNRLPEAFDAADFLGRYKATGEGYYKIDKGGQQLLVSFTTSRYNQWKYVAVLPVNEIYSRTHLIGGMIAFLCLTFVLLAVGLSFAASKGIYNPIGALDQWLRGRKRSAQGGELLKARNDELGRIRQEIDDQLAKLRNYFLHRLTYGSVTDKDEIHTQADFLDIPVDRQFVALLVELDRGGEGGADREATRAAVAGSVQGALAEAGCLLNVAWEYRDDSERLVAVTVFGAERPAADIWPVLAAAVGQARGRIGERCRATVTVAVGTAQTGLENIRVSYNEANEVLKHKFIKGADAVIFSHEAAGGMSVDARKHYAKSQLTNCLDARDRRQLEKLLAKFKASMKTQVSAKAAYVFYCKDIIDILREYLRGLGPRFAAERAALKDMFDNFEKRFDNIDAAVAAIMDCAAQALEKLEKESPEAARRQAVGKAVAIIAAEYGDDIGLTYVCEKVGMSEPYFSKIFKEELGQNFKDYLTGIRLDKAKELLRDTDATIAAVADQVGYNNTNQFAKMFKKYEGVTPGAYRESARNKSRVINLRQYKKNQER